MNKASKSLVFFISIVFIYPSIFPSSAVFSKEGVFLNKGTSYELKQLPSNLKMKAKYVKINYNTKAFSYNQYYYVKGNLTKEKLRLMEYDTITKIAIREDIVPVSVLNLLDEKALKDFYRGLYLHYHLLRDMDYPREVKKVHQAYLEIVESGGEIYLSIEKKKDFSQLGVVGRIMSTYTRPYNLKKFYKANLKLLNLLENKQIKPAR